MSDMSKMFFKKDARKPTKVKQERKLKLNITEDDLGF